MIERLVPISDISNTGFGKYLASISSTDVIIGLHGWEHKCPVCGSTLHEVGACDRLKLSDISSTIDNGKNVFEDLGIMNYIYVAPGMSWDYNTSSLLSMKLFEVEVYDARIQSNYNGDLHRSNGEVMLATYGHVNMPEPNGDSLYIAEYTWGIDNEIVMTEDYVEILLIHAQDWNEYSRSFMKEMLRNNKTSMIRIDDITISDRNVMDEVLCIVNLYDARVIFAVIPTYMSGGDVINNNNVARFIYVSWIIFLLSFVFIQSYIMLWYLGGGEF